MTLTPEQLNDQPVFESDGWCYKHKPNGQGDCRKLVTLHDRGMAWVGVRAWHDKQGWMNGNEPELHTIHAWRDLEPPATGFWLSGILHLTEREP